VNVRSSATADCTAVSDVATTAMSVPSVPESPVFSVIRGGPSSLVMVSAA
jgi:hypothetical protein